jgi:hypothetical protein
MKYLSLNPFMQSSAIGFASQESLYSSICDFAINANQIFGHSLMWALVMFFLQVLFYLWVTTRSLVVDSSIVYIEIV